MSIAASLEALQGEIEDACRAAGRDPAAETLIAVTKMHPALAVREAQAAGIRVVGENRVQELVAKRPLLEDLDLVWHFIGGLQTNKVKSVLPLVGLIHSVDRVELAQAIARHASGRVVPILLQVNTTAEASKSGVAPERLPFLLDEVRSIGSLDVRGLMTIGPLGGTERENRRAFALLRELRDRAIDARAGLDLPILSMGMSDDFREAILEGATHLRIGSRIFGDRSYPTAG